MNARPSIIHIEGDPDHPVNRGTLCPNGSALLDVVHVPLTWRKRVSWDIALNRIARLIKQDRDANFVARNAAGTPVNRWITTAMLAASASTNETAYLTWKIARSFGMLVFDKSGEGLTRTNGGQSGPNVQADASRETCFHSGS
jgi:formate dehydrogenase major subunit